jgi:hypothetical protein
MKTTTGELHKTAVETNDSPNYDIFDLLYQQQTTIDLIAQTFQLQPTEESPIVVEKRSLRDTRKGSLQPDSLEIQVRATHGEQSISTSFPSANYLNAFLEKRLHRASGYFAIQDSFNPNLYLVFEQSTRKNISNLTCIPKPQREVNYCSDTGILSCSCPDHTKQLELLPQHPALWELMQEQAVCKHIIAVCLDYPQLAKAITHLACPTIHTAIQVKRIAISVKVAMQKQKINPQITKPFNSAAVVADLRCPNILEGLSQSVLNTLYNTTLLPPEGDATKRSLRS